MKQLWILFVLAGLCAACGHQQARPCLPVPCLPQPYWEPPASISPLPEETELLVTTLSPLTKESTPEERERFLEAVSMDLIACEGDEARLRFLYQELVRLVKTEPE